MLPFTNNIHFYLLTVSTTQRTIYQPQATSLPSALPSIPPPFIYRPKAIQTESRTIQSHRNVIEPQANVHSCLQSNMNLVPTANASIPISVFPSHRIWSMRNDRISSSLPPLERDISSTDINSDHVSQYVHILH